MTVHFEPEISDHEQARPPLTPYVHPPETEQHLEYADLVTLDLAGFDHPEGKKRLAAQLKNALTEVGFFNITNFGLTEEEVNRQFAIARDFYALPYSERVKYRGPMETEGIYSGYRPIGSTEVQPGLRDNIEHYNILKFLPQFEQPHPEVLRQHWEEIGRFHRHMHENIAYKLLRLIAIILEIPEDYLVGGHLYDSNCDSHIRYMMSRKRSPAENEKYCNMYLRGHTDRGTLSFVFQQPVAGLQIKRNEGSNWEYIRIRPGTVTVNSADLIGILTNGYLKAGLHRVVAPPEDQTFIDRIGVLYFVRPSDQLMLETLDSPLLRRLGYCRESENHIPALEWTRERVRKAFSSDPRATTQIGGFSAVSFHE